jgi:hypothetical protein
MRAARVRGAAHDTRRRSTAARCSLVAHTVVARALSDAGAPAPERCAPCRRRRRRWPASCTAQLLARAVGSRTCSFDVARGLAAARSALRRRATLALAAGAHSLVAVPRRR